MKRKIRGVLTPTKRAIVIEYYPNAKPEKRGELIWIVANHMQVLGRGKTNRAAWVAAYNNLNR